MISRQFRRWFMLNVFVKPGTPFGRPVADGCLGALLADYVERLRSTYNLNGQRALTSVWDYWPALTQTSALPRRL
ncbi:MAG: hypothetical protein M5R40_06705 [Anaerolineae bacterium]|nr:hypothetical protein [Anaerolineae bacterium]